MTLPAPQSVSTIMNTSWKLAAAATLALLPALFLPATSSADDAASGATEPGIWQKHEYTFVYMGFTTTYSCDGLADKIKVLLIAAGARGDAKSRAGACALGYGRPDKFARAYLTFYALAPAAAAAAAASPPEAKPIDAAWRPVSLSAYSPRELARGDCELIEQFRNNVLPMFTTRNLNDRTSCVPHQESGSNFSLQFESLAATPKNLAK
jgi:hypothetical protein